MEIIDNPYLMQPLLPAEGNKELGDLSFELVREASSLASKLPQNVISSVGELIRSMNCYYSNLIEGHNTHPVDIERALRKDYSQDENKRNLQQEALAHIEVQRAIDESELPASICSREYLCWIHKEFCSRLPEDLLIVKNPETQKVFKVIAGEIRTGEVRIGNHLAPIHSKIIDFLELFQKRYEAKSLSKMQKIIAIAASHHRFLWIHPFFDGNGRVARLFSHAFLKQVGLGNSLWSVSRGLAKSADQYKLRLAAADCWRQGDTDGKGSLSEKALLEFCIFFLSTCLDQVKFMSSLLQPETLLERVSSYCKEEEAKGRLSRGSFGVLREILHTGELARGRVAEVVGYKERQARNIVRVLTERNLLVSQSTRSPLLLNIPYEVVERWFPTLYPADLV